MNTYQDNLRTTVKQTLAELSAEQGKLTTLQQNAESNVYYSQGAYLTAKDKLAAGKAEVSSQ